MPSPNQNPEQIKRDRIDAMLKASGWVVKGNKKIDHALKRKPMRAEDLAEFITCYHSANRHQRKEIWHAEKSPEGRWRNFSYDELTGRDKISLDIFWLKDQSLSDLAPPRPQRPRRRDRGEHRSWTKQF